MKTKIWILVLSLAALACGQSLNAVTLPTQAATEISTEVDGIWMVVVNAPEGLRVRPAPGDMSTYTDVLHNGDRVYCTEFYTGEGVGESIWCKHSRGWSNTRWLLAK